MNSDINLIGNKDHSGIPVASKRLKLMRALAIVLLFGVSAASVILYILISLSPLPQVREQEQQALASLAGSHTEMTKIALINDRMIGISSILSQRNKYDTFLKSIQSKMPLGIKTYQISMAKKTVTLTVKSSSLDDLNTFTQNLIDATNVKDKKEYSQVVLNNIVSDNESNYFSLTVSITML